MTCSAPASIGGPGSPASIAYFEAAWLQIDWLAFADAWRALYQPSMEEVRSGRQPFVKLDVLHRRMLDQIRPKFGLEKLDNKVADDLTLPGIASIPGPTPCPASCG